MIILYSHYEDLASAELLQKQFGGTIIKRLYGSGPYITTEDIIIIGGQFTNDTYEYYMNLYPGTFPFITSADAGYGFVRVIQIGSQKVYASAGWNRIDTVTASTWFLENGLPTANYDVQAAHGISIIQIKLTEEARDGIVSNPNGIMDWANDYLLRNYGSEYKVVWYYLTGDILEIVCFHNLAPVIAYAIWIAIYAIIGLSILAAAGYIWTKYFDAETGSAEKVSDMASLANQYRDDAIADGIDPDLAEKGAQELIKSYQEGLGDDIFKKIGYILIVGAGVYAFIAVGVPLLKSLIGKGGK